MSAPRTSPALSLAEALLPLVVMLLLFAGGVLVLPLSSELIVVVLLGAAAVAGGVAVRQGATWDDIQRAAGEKLAAVLPVVLILIAIGALIGTWMLSGTIPLLVYWGVSLVDPRFLALTAFLTTALMSTFTGTSWGSASTLGVAMVATGAALGAPLPLVAGAVVSGAYFGDKMSPLSDSTIIAAVAARADLYRHIRHMLYTAGPSFVVCLIVYGLAQGAAAAPSGQLPADATALLSEIEGTYRLNVLTALPALIVLICMITRVPAALAIVLSATVAAIIGVTAQQFAVDDAVRAAVSGFRTVMIPAAAGAPAPSDAFVRLVERGGMFSMASTLVIIITAFLLAGAMEVSGALSLLVTRLMTGVRSTFGLIAATMTAGATMVALTSHGGVTMLVVGSLFQRGYDERGLAPQNLSRSLEDSVTVTEPLMPWTVSAMFMATTLGVPTVAYAPWAVFCYGGPLFSLLIAAAYERLQFGLVMDTAPQRDVLATSSGTSSSETRRDHR
jgi:NhaC family Na+:H+ antiporter